MVKHVAFIHCYIILLSFFFHQDIHIIHPSSIYLSIYLSMLCEYVFMCV